MRIETLGQWGFLVVIVLLALGCVWLVGVACGLNYNHDYRLGQAAKTGRRPSFTPVEQLCCDAISYFLACERVPVQGSLIMRYVALRARWLVRGRVRRALAHLTVVGLVRQVNTEGAGRAYEWTSSS